MAGLIARYEELLAHDELRPDEEQKAAIHRLARLQEELEASPASQGFFARLKREKPPRPRGIYMWGDVGRGKSMMMDLFHETLDIAAKRRVHFHEFMLEVDQRLRDERKKESGDPVAPVARQLGEGIRCLCFDEMVVKNTADAMIMSRLFTALIRDEGVTVVTTSNRPPRDLYKDGLNRGLFLPFIDLIEAELDTLTLNGPTDYRLERLGGMDVWYSPTGPAATEKAREAFFRLTDYPPEDAEHVTGHELKVGEQRSLWVPKSLKGVAVFSFKRLCAQPRGSSDFLAIARHYHSVIIVGIPVMGPDMLNEAARFVTLIDALYENGVKLIATADADPADLYPSGNGAFEFGRTVSRLMEMQSADYLARGHGEQ
ncbi:MAG: cell division protein ZapE [Croceicoccus sp.]|nr:cell division protein ZapE [Croceicoccus sp.]